MLQKRRTYLLAIVAAAPALFSFCAPKSDPTKFMVETCPADSVETTTTLFLGEECTLILYDSKCQQHSMDIDCDQKDQLTESPQRVKALSDAFFKTGAGSQSSVRLNRTGEVSRAASGTNVRVQSMQHLLPLGLDLYTTSPAVVPTITCPAGLNFYAVEHTLATVAHEFPCSSPPYPRIHVQTRPLQLAATPDSTELWVTSYDNAITVIDTSSDQVLATIRTDQNTFPSGIAISPDGTRVYVTSFIDDLPALITYNRMTRTEIARLALPGQYPQSVFLTPDGSTALITYPLTNAVYAVDILSNTVIGSRLINQPYGVGFSSNGTTAYISSWPNSVVTMDMTTLSVSKTYQVGQGPLGVLVSANGHWVTTANFNDGSMSNINLTSGTVTSTQGSGNNQGIIALN